MAYDNPLFPTGRGYALLKAESTYGTDPSVAVTDFMNFDEFDLNFEEDTIERGGRSPQRIGWRSLAGQQTMSWSCMMEMLMQAITVADGSTDLPQVDPLLRACGFDRVDNTLNQDAYTYVCTRNQEGSFWVQNYMVNENMDSLNVMTARGCRGSFTIEFTAGERVMLSCDGMGKTNGGVSTFSHADRAPDDVTDTTDDPIMTIAATNGSKFIDLADLVPEGSTARDGTGTALYGGGTIATPSNLVDVMSMTINGNMNPVAHRGFGAGRDPHRIFMDAQERMTADISFEVCDQDDWNPYALRYRSPIEFNFTFKSDIPAGTSTMQVLFYGFLTSVEMDEIDGRHVYNCSVDIAYPEDPTSGVPAVGNSPAQEFEAGTNQGLNVAPDAALTPGLLAIQFSTS